MTSLLGKLPGDIRRAFCCPAEKVMMGKPLTEYQKRQAHQVVRSLRAKLTRLRNATEPTSLDEAVAAGFKLPPGSPELCVERAK
jgi:hypothetical protein